MGNKFWGRIGLFASMVAGAGTASAADLPVKAPKMVPAAPVYVYDWTGFYIGVNGGGGFGNNKFDMMPALNRKPSGGIVGGHAGYAWQSGSIVGGLEVDFDGADITKTFTTAARTTAREKTDELATVRARIGYLVLPDLLAYGTAGAAFGHTEVTAPAAAAITTNAVNQFGWVAGAGLEYKFWDHFMARVEYLHYDFAKTTLPAFGPLRQSVDAVRGGLSYKF
jgi:outer membrane immunogenic protein